MIKIQLKDGIVVESNYPDVPVVEKYIGKNSKNEHDILMEKLIKYSAGPFSTHYLRKRYKEYMEKQTAQEVNFVGVSSSRVDPPYTVSYSTGQTVNGGSLASTQLDEAAVRSGDVQLVADNLFRENEERRTRILGNTYGS